MAETARRPVVQEKLVNTQADMTTSTTTAVMRRQGTQGLQLLSTATRRTAEGGQDDVLMNGRQQ